MNADEARPLCDETEDFWAQCSLTTLLGEVPTHHLLLPGQQQLVLQTRDFFDVTRFSIAFIDAVGSFPPLPKKKPAPFLRGMFETWLSLRRTIEVHEEEGGARGMLLGDIRRAILALAETDDPRDMARGSIYPRPDGAAWINGRVLLDRVTRSCPTKFTAFEFYSVLTDAGGISLREPQRAEGWRGRVWLIPAALRPSLEVGPDAAPELPAAAPPAPPSDSGPSLFGEYLESALDGDGARHAGSETTPDPDYFGEPEDL